MGSVPDGVFDLSQPDIAAALQRMAQLRSVDVLRRMVGLLSAASSDELLAIRQVLTGGAAGRTEDQIVQGVRQAAPRLADRAGLFRDRDSRIELATWLMLLVAIISIVIAIKASHQEVTVPRQEQIIQVIVPANAGRYSPGRNERCPCGSGLKYKRCHGSPSARP